MVMAIIVDWPRDWPTGPLAFWRRFCVPLSSYPGRLRDTCTTRICLQLLRYTASTMSWTFTKLLLLSAALINYQMSTETGNFLQAYLTNTPRVDWQRLSIMVAADMINERAKRKRKATREILKQRRIFWRIFHTRP
ncbi:hypothetical protein MTO96_033862 [Rhipicephalus appendiculatus]